MSRDRGSLLSLLVISFGCKLVFGLNILVFLPGTTDDDRRPLARIAQDLAFRNHIVGAFKAIIIPEKRYLVKQKIHEAQELNLKTEVGPELYEPLKRVGDILPWAEEYDTKRHLVPYYKAHVAACDSVLNSDLMQKLKEDRYDVALVYAGNPCNLAVVHILSVPFIYFDMTGFSDEVVMASGMPSLPGYMPSSLSTFPQQMTAFQRWKNLWLQAKSYAPFADLSKLSFVESVAQYETAVNIILLRYALINAFTNLHGQPKSWKWIARLLSDQYRLMDQPITEMLRSDYELKKRFPRFPDVNDIKQRAALYFVNSDASLEFPGRPTMPNVIYVGGSHVEYPRPLFEPYNISNAAAPKGVILFSFGIIANASAMPPYMHVAFREAFRRLSKYRVYWRTTVPGEIFKDMPPNVNVTAFIPQNDLMAAKETRLLITNGGMHSIMEAVYHGIPVLGIPLYGPNYHNLRKVEAHGFGIILEKRDVTVESVYSAIIELAEGKTHKQAAKEISRAYKDQPLSAFETVIYWIEYVGRNHGAAHLESKILRELTLVQYLLLDVFMAGIVLLYCFKTVVQCLYSMLCSCCARIRKIDGVKSGNEAGTKGAEQNHTNGVGPRKRKAAKAE